MRNLFGLILFASALAGCTSRNLGFENNGDMGRADLAPPVNCAALGEADCETSNLDCVADRCNLCDCNGSTFMACRSAKDEPQGCPPIFCTDDSYCGCSKYDEQSCNQHPGCSAIYCESQCAEAPIYQGCFGPNDGAPYCEPNDCVPTCEQSNECDPGQFCHANDQPWCYCDWVSSTCNGDFDCGGDEICSWSQCGCDPNVGRCVPACKGDSDCSTGQECEQKRCRDKTCKKSSDCPAQFWCNTISDERDHCDRIQCTSDASCKGGYCVDGLCYEQPGMCTWLPD